MPFGTELRVLRAAAGLTQEELAERAGLTANGVSALERGTRTRPYPHTVRALADALALGAAERERFMASARDADGRPVPGPPPVTVALPAPVTELIGRQSDVRRLCDLIDRPQHRLITLTGPGGVGKTRLAVEAARKVGPASFARVTFVSLAPLSDPALVPSVVAAALRPDADRHGVDRRRDESGTPRRALIVLDNFEHLIDAAPAVVDLLAAYPPLTVLVSSRARLRLRGETEFPVPPLALPASTDRPTPLEVSSSAAGRLFVERARAVQPDFAVTAQTAADIAAICRRLGGLPLAVELAAAKVKVLGPRDLLDRLDDALSAGWSRDLPARQHTLRSTLDWSYRLLDKDEQSLLRHLSVFAGGFSLATAEDLTGEVLGREQVLPLLEALVEHSLVVVRRDPTGATQFSLLEPIREYAAALLRESGEDEAATAQHAEYFLALAERAVPEYHHHDQVRWLERTDWESDNLRAAMQWALSRGAGVTAARLGWALWQPWWMRGQFDEGRRRMEAVLRLDLPSVLRTRALVVHASMSDAQGDLHGAERSWTAALECARDGDDLAGQAYGLAGTGLVAMSTDPQRAAALLTEAVSLAERVQEDWLLSLGTIWLGTLRLVAGDPDSAAEGFRRALAAAQVRGDRLASCVALINLGRVALVQGDPVAAETALRESVLLSKALRDRVNVTFALDLLAAAAASGGDWSRCAVLVGAARGLRAFRPAVRNYYLPDAELQASMERDAEAALGAVRFKAALEEGQALNLDDITDFVCRLG